MGRRPLRTAALLLGAALLAGFGGGEQRPPDAEQPATYAEERLTFAELLTRYRQGEDDVLDELRASGQRFARHHGRDDAPRVVDYYASLSAQERAAGWRDFEAFGALWQRVAEADGESWTAERPRVLAELRALAERALARPDSVPAGQALSLAARIEVQGAPGGTREDAAARAARARDEARRALELFERAGQQTPRLEPLWCLGRLELEAGWPEEARRWFEECSDLALKVRSDTWREKGLVGEIQVARFAGDVLRIDALLEELATFRDPLTCWPLARELAWRLIDEDDGVRAVRHLESAPPAGAHDRDEWLRLLGLARLRTGDIEGARRELECIEEPGVEAQLALATVALAEERPDAALAALGDDAARAALRVYERMYALSLEGEAELRAGRAVEARTLLHEAIALAESIEERLARGGQRTHGTAAPSRQHGGIAEHRGTAAPSRQHGGIAGHRGTAAVFGERLGLHTVLVAAQAELELGRPLEAALVVERSQARALGSARLEAADILAWAARYELGLLTFVCAADAGLALHVAPDGSVEAKRIEHGRRALFAGARRLREALLADDSERAMQLGEELAAALLPGGLREQLARAEGGRLALVVHGPIERLPVEQLALNGRPLEWWCTPLVLPGLPARRPPGATLDLTDARWWLLGDPRDAAGASLLPSAAEELRELALLHPDAERSTAAAFDAERARAAVASGRSLHVATHLRNDARCADDRLAALGLELDAGAMLCASEVRAAAAPSPLVVLSACATGEGHFLDAEGLLGLARAFLETGTRNLLVTLWPVRDDAARDYALAFHRALLAGEPPSEAARTARAALRVMGHGLADASAFRLVGCD